MLAGVTSRGPSPCASDFGFGIYGMTSEAICWLQSSAGWMRDNPRLRDFCVRESAIGAAATSALDTKEKTARQVCVSSDLSEAARHDARALMRAASINPVINDENCGQLESFLARVTSLDISRAAFRQTEWFLFAPNLESLIARDNLILNAAPLTTLPRLKFVDLRGNTISDIQIFEQFQHTTRVFGKSTQRATLDQTHYRELAEKGAALISEKRATVIALRDLLVSGVIPRKSRDLALRRELNLDRRDIRSLEALRGLENLESLSVSGNTDITAWEELLTLPALKVLRLDRDSSFPADIEELLKSRGVSIIKMTR